MRDRGVFLMVTVALCLAVMPVAAPAGAVSADTDKLITSLVLDEAEADALGLLFESLDDTSSSAVYVTARYRDESPGPYYSIVFNVTLSPCTSMDGVSLASVATDCSNCVEPDCQERELSNGDRFPNRPCYSAYRNGYTDFGSLEGETVFAQGDVLVRIESSTSHGPTSVADYELSRSKHEWFVEQVAAKLDAGYQSDMMEVTARAYIDRQPTGADVYMSGQDVVVLEGTVMGPNSGLEGVRLDGFYYSESGSGWNYAVVTDSSGTFRSVMGAPGEVASMTVKARHTDTSPVYAGTVPIRIEVSGQATGVVDTGMSVGVKTDKTVYAAGEMVLISCNVADSEGPVSGASLVIDMNGSPTYATTNASGEYKVACGLDSDMADGVYAVTVTASHPDYPDAKDNTTFIVGAMAVLVEQNPVTGNPYVGVAADGVSTLKMSVSLPGCTDVSVTLPSVGELKGDCVSASGAIQLDAAGQAEFTYCPPGYLTKEQLSERIDVHGSDVKTWCVRVPMTFSYTGANGQAGRLDGAILVCRPPVMLVHGFVGSTATWGKMSTYLRGEKFDTFLGNYLLQDLSIEELSGVLQSDIVTQKFDYARSELKLTKVDAVGHSMGGVISRYYANGLPGYTGDLRKLIMVATPNHGVSWIKKKVGNAAANWYDTHRVPGEQLYSESPFMRALNAGERSGAHLNVDVQYGNLYGYPDDWVVSAGSAYLNGVRTVLQLDVKHSADIAGVPKVAITENLATWEQVRDWLLGDIFRPALASSHAEVHKFWGDVYIDDFWSSVTTKVAAIPAALEPFQVLRTGNDSKAIVHLTIEGIPWGVIFLDPDSEILLGYFSPQLVEVRLSKGSATFTSKKDGHFSVPVNISRQAPGEWWKTSPQTVVTGLDTEFAINAGAEVVVHCLDGSLMVDTEESLNEGVTVEEGESVSVNGETLSAAPVVSADDFWWSEEEDDFLDEGFGGGLLDRLKGLLAALINWIQSLI